jgi:STE24 endopeptidase
MGPQAILYLIIGITMLGYFFGQILEYLNLKALRTDIPEEVSAFYDKQKYEKSLEYHRELTRFSFLTSALGFLVSLGMLWFGGFGAIDIFLKGVTDHEILRALLFFGVLMLASDILNNAVSIV